MNTNITYGAEETWIDDHADEQVKQTLANSPEMQEIANDGVLQDANYLVETNGKAITSNNEQDNDLNESGLMNDQEWIRASKIAYRFYMGRDGKNDINNLQLTAESMNFVSGNELLNNVGGYQNYQGNMNSPNFNPLKIPSEKIVPHEQRENTPMSDRDYAEWGLEFMGQFNWNLPMMGLRSGQLAVGDTSPSATPYGDPKLATYILMDKYDKLPNWTWSGTKRAFRGLISDPTTYAGLTTLGFAFVGKGAAKTATKGAMKKFLKASISPTALVAYEGGAYAGSDNALRQSINIMSNSQSKFNYGTLGRDVVIGMTFGGAIAGGANNLYRILPKERTINKIYKTAQDAQENLVDYLKQTIETKPIVSDTSRFDVANPGIKEKDKAIEKIDRKGYATKDLKQKLTDIVRSAVVVDNPKDADEIVSELGKKYKIVEDGWEAYPGGYFDRKLVVETPEGNLAEIQFWSKGIAKVKEVMHENYAKARKLEPLVKNGQANKQQIEEYNLLLVESDKVAADALVADMGAWQEIYTQIGLDVTPYLQLVGS